MISENRKELSVTEYALYGETTFGFALPVLAVPDEPNIRAIQEIDEYLNIVRAFRVLNYDTLELHPLESSVAAKIGGDIIHVFISNKQVHVGSIKVLEPILRDFISSFPNQVSISIQIMELIGTREEKRSARRKMRDCIADNIGPFSSRAFYDRSTLRAVVWDRLIAAAPSADAAKRLMESRTKIDATTDPTGKVSIDLSAINPSDYRTLSITEFTNEIQQEFDGFTEDDKDTDIKQQDFSGIQTGRITAALHQAKSAGQKEERMAILLDKLIQNPENSSLILRQYGPDKSLYGNRVLQQLLFPALLNSTSAQTTEHIEFIVANLVAKLYTATFTMDRGVMLYYLAKHLSKYPLVNRAIRSRIAKSRSRIVELYVREINKFLGASNNQDKNIL